MESNILTLSIDPGLSGAAVLLDHTGNTILSREASFTDVYDLAHRIGRLASQASDCVIEFVSAMPGQGVVSMFSFGAAYGAAKATLACAGWDNVPGVAPLKWQNHIRRRQKMEKKAPFDSREIALQLWPYQADMFKRKLDHNTADAALIGLYRIETRDLL